MTVDNQVIRPWKKLAVWPHGTCSAEGECIIFERLELSACIGHHQWARVQAETRYGYTMAMMMQ